MNDSVFTYTKLPGVWVHLVPYPTLKDQVGCDGLYVYAVIIADAKKFQGYCDGIGKTWYKFSDN